MTASVRPRHFESEWTEWDLHLYGRQSDLSSFGNSSTALQEEDLLVEVARQLGIDPKSHAGVFQYAVEVMSGTDADIEIEYGEDGEDPLVQFPRRELLLVFSRMIKRYLATGRAQLLCVYKLNRLARSGDFTFFLNDVVRRTRGAVRIWSAKEGVLRPGTPEGDMMLNLHCGISGGGESKTKSDFVRDSFRRVAKNDATRSLGEQIVGYRVEARDGARRNGRDRKELHLVVDREPNAHLCGMSQEELVRKVFAMARDGARPSEITASLNASGLRHPHTGALFGAPVVKRMLRDTIYVGRRVRGKNTVLWIGSKRKRQTKREEWIEAPYSDALRIVDDATFERVAAVLDARATPTLGRRRAGGRPSKAVHYFAGGEALKCAACGRTMSAAKKSYGWIYACSRGSELGGFACQSHDAAALDAALDRHLSAALSGFRSYVEVLRKELEEDTSAKRREQMEADLSKKRRSLRLLEDQLLDPDFEEDARKALKARYNALTKEVAALEVEVNHFGQSEDVRQKRKHLVRAEMLAAFETMTKAERKAALKLVMERVWAWPDGYLHVERLSRPVDTTQRPVYVGPHAREVLYALDWPALDFERMRSDLVRLVERGGLEVGDFFPTVTKMSARRVLDRQFRQTRPNTLVRLYHCALHKALDLPRLRAALETRLRDRLAGGESMEDVRRSERIDASNLRRLLDGSRLGKRTLLDIAARWGIDQGAFRPDLAEFYQPDYLDEMVYWIDAAQRFGMERRLADDLARYGGAKRKGYKELAIPRRLGATSAETEPLGCPPFSFDSTITKSVSPWCYSEFRDLVLGGVRTER